MAMVMVMVMVMMMMPENLQSILTGFPFMKNLQNINRISHHENLQTISWISMKPAKHPLVSP
jgi:hypothetical protein